MRVVAERVEGHDGVGHGRKDAAEPVFAVEAAGRETHGARNRARAERTRNERFQHAERLIEREERRT